MWWFTTVILASIVSGLIGFFAASYRFYQMNELAAKKIADSDFLIKEEVENSRVALEYSEMHQSKAKKAERAAQEAAKEAKSILKNLEIVAEKNTDEIIKKIKSKLNEITKEIRREERAKLIRERPEPCKECSGLGYRKSKNNRKYDCKFCKASGLVVRKIVPD